jgi:8-oxo-dGTP pyrophosphatase MutT (NUDIX family)
MLPTKACPVVFRDASFSRILVFKHPLAGVQLVKGSIETDEEPAAAALRELCEETGICDARVDRDLGVWVSGFEGQVWSFHLCSVSLPLPDSWVHHAKDDGGLKLDFYWHSVSEQAEKDWHPVFRGALQYILGAVALRENE